jgi:hypothetical protein
MRLDMGTSETDWKKKTGSNIKAIGYNAKEAKILVTFENGTIYSYGPATEKQFNDFNEAPSVGSYFHKKIKINKNYKFEKLDGNII